MSVAGTLNSMTYFLHSSSRNPFFIQNTLLESKLLSQGRIEQDHLSKNVKNLESNKKINFSTESVKNQNFMTCYSLLQFILFKISIDISLK